eukprot:TRINITY_DN46878_c0_g1_i1.p1 TRINITY_DN46878_c0_g1~~TRINITY_DN46878_c0_g1_i1.p1  ORF type:complete len:909 (+),score=185.60 TRINITY_DN46878_c0_g1_i1:75-2801(+)
MAEEPAEQPVPTPTRDTPSAPPSVQPSAGSAQQGDGAPPPLADGKSPKKQTFVTEVPGQGDDDDDTPEDPYAFVAAHLASHLQLGLPPPVTLPNGLRTRGLLQRAFRRTRHAAAAGTADQKAGPWPCSNELAEVVLSEASQAIVAHGFWWSTLELFGDDINRGADLREREEARRLCPGTLPGADEPIPPSVNVWRPGSTDMQALFRGMARGYGAVFTRCLFGAQPASSGRAGGFARDGSSHLLLHYPDIVAQAVHRGLIGCFRNHPHLRGESVRRALSSRFHHWAVGVTPSVLSVSHWLAEEERSAAARARKQVPAPAPQTLQQRLQRYEAQHMPQPPAGAASPAGGAEDTRRHGRRASLQIPRPPQAPPPPPPPPAVPRPPASAAEPPSGVIIPLRLDSAAAPRWWEAGRRCGGIVAGVDGRQAQPVAGGGEAWGCREAFLTCSCSPFLTAYLEERGIHSAAARSGEARGQQRPRLSWWYASEVETSPLEVAYAPLGRSAAALAQDALQEQKRLETKLLRREQRDRREYSAIRSDLDAKTRAGHRAIRAKGSATSRQQRALIKGLERQVHNALNWRGSDPAEAERRLTAALEEHDRVLGHLHPRQRQRILQLAITLRHRLSHVKTVHDRGDPVAMIPPDEMDQIRAEYDAMCSGTWQGAPSEGFRDPSGPSFDGTPVPQPYVLKQGTDSLQVGCLTPSFMAPPSMRTPSADCVPPACTVRSCSSSEGTTRRGRASLDPTGEAADVLERLKLPDLHVPRGARQPQTSTVLMRETSHYQRRPTVPDWLLPAVPALSVVQQKFSVDLEEYTPAWRTEAEFLKGLRPSAASPCGDWPAGEPHIPGGVCSPLCPRPPPPPAAGAARTARVYKPARRVRTKRPSFVELADTAADLSPARTPSQSPGAEDTASR